MSDEALRMARAEEAHAAMMKFLGPAFDVCRSDYLEKLGEIAAKPLTADMRAGMEKLALGVKVIDEVRSQIEAVIVDGRVAANSKAGADQLAKLTSEKRKWLY